MGSDPCKVMSFIKRHHSVLLTGDRNTQRLLFSAPKRQNSRH